MSKKRFKGKVVSNKMQKAVIVSVEIHKRHPLYDKTLRNTRRFKARADAALNIGDIVWIEESRPYSKCIPWSVVEKVSEAKK